MPPTLCGNLCITWWGGTGTDVRARIRREEAMVRRVRTDEGRGAVAAAEEVRGVQEKGLVSPNSSAPIVLCQNMVCWSFGRFFPRLVDGIG
jgi:hypothetical protein